MVPVLLERVRIASGKASLDSWAPSKTKREKRKERKPKTVLSGRHAPITGTRVSNSGTDSPSVPCCTPNWVTAGSAHPGARPGPTRMSLFLGSTPPGTLPRRGPVDFGTLGSWQGAWAATVWGTKVFSSRGPLTHSHTQSTVVFFFFFSFTAGDSQGPLPMRTPPWALVGKAWLPRCGQNRNLQMGCDHGHLGRRTSQVWQGVAVVCVHSGLPQKSQTAIENDSPVKEK